jgi:3'-5' exoribonuclease
VAKVFVSDIQPGQEVESTFVIEQKELRTARNGNTFLTLKLRDRTGRLTGRVWERAEELGRTVSAGTVVRIRGRSETYRDELQLSIVNMAPVPAEAIRPGDYLPVSPIAPESLWKDLTDLMLQVERRPLRELLRRIFSDPEIADRFKKAPAAKSMHHAYLGGLLEHTVAVARLADRICGLYGELDRDLLLAGALLHDIGKIREFTYDLVIDYSPVGRLVGHMVLGAEILEDKLQGIRGFPEEDALLLKHLILSHHGQTEFGAVQPPMTREAVALHFADDLDAKMNNLTRILEESEGTDGLWTAYQPLHNRFFFKGWPARDEVTSTENLEEAPPEIKQLRLWDPAREKRRDG